MTVKTTNRFSKVLYFDDETLTRATAFAEFVSEAFKMKKKSSATLRLVIEELVSNSINHGENTADGTIEITLSLNDRIIIEYSDSGKPFNPVTAFEFAKLNDATENETSGGLGWTMINHYYQINEYRYTNSRNNLVLSQITAQYICR